jgi:thiosulfate dehydrogenase [quinone] large subunit
VASLRQYALYIGIVDAILLVIIANPWFVVTGVLRDILTVAFWVVSIVLVVVLFEDRKEPGSTEVEVQGPAFTRYLFHNTRAGLLWLPIRLFVGFEWLDAGWHKLTGTGWVDGGSSLAGYWQRAAEIPEGGRPPITFEWYRDFINLLLNNHSEGWFAWLITLGELAVGLGLILGALTGIAAFFGALMNMSFLLAGSGSVNPVLFTLAVGLMLAWRVAGYYGLDRYLLPMLGTPWTRRVALHETGTPQPTTT